MIRWAWVTPVMQHEIAGSPLEVSDVIETDRKLSPFDLEPLSSIAGLRRWTCIGVDSSGYALVRTDDKATP